MSKVNFAAMTPRTIEENIIAERLNTLIGAFGARAVVHGEDHSSMDIDICTDIDGKSKRVLRIDVETKPEKYSFSKCYPYPHPDWIPKPYSNKRGWSFLYRKVVKMYKDPRGRELVDKDDLYILCDKRCDKLYVATFGEILANCELTVFHPSDKRYWYYRYPAVVNEIPNFIHTGSDGGYNYIVMYIKNRINKMKELQINVA